MMSEKIAVKTQAQSIAKLKPAARKAVVKKAPASVAVSKKPRVAPEQDKKTNRAVKTSGKTKKVCDSFNMPQSDYEKIDALKQKCLKSGLQVKKSQLLRAGLHVLEKLSASQLKIALSGIVAVHKKESGNGK